MRTMATARRRAYVRARGWHLRWWWQAVTGCGDPFVGGVPVRVEDLPRQGQER